MFAEELVFVEEAAGGEGGGHCSLGGGVVVCRGKWGAGEGFEIGGVGGLFGMHSWRW